MLRLLVLVALVAVAVYAVVRMLNQAPSAPRIRATARRAERSLPPLDTGDLEEPAAIAHGSDKGFGVLRLTPSQLIFAGGSGRVLTIERMDITGVSATSQLPDRVTAKPVLAVTTPDTVRFFAVEDPLTWERRLL
ncbi:MAG: hypothetical protein R2720_05260 [Candidatus Nanopelagicales bacterium]